MSNDHQHAIPKNTNEKMLWIAFGLTGTFLVTEFVAALILNSLALLSDAAHMLTDVAALAIALAAIRIGRRKYDQRRTFGYYRFEILAATFNALMLFGVAIYILFEAWIRFKNPEAVASKGMMIVAAVGLIINLISLRLLSSGKYSSINLKGAYLEVWSDTLGSLGVIVGGVIIYFTNWLWVDTAVAVLIGLWVIPRTWVLLTESLNILLEGVPEGIDISEIEKAMLAIPGVISVHELHVWGLTTSRNSLTAHIVIQEKTSQQDLQQQLRALLEDDFEINHTTFQLELEPCREAINCNFHDMNDLASSH